MYLTTDLYNLIAQKDTTIARNTIFAEIFGNGFIGSVNYDRLFFISENKFSVRGGMIYLPSFLTFNSYSFVIPLGFSVLLGQKHHYELGLGLTYVNNIENQYDRAGNNHFSKSVFAFARVLGYRFQKNDGGLFVKVGIDGVFRVVEFNDEFKKARNRFNKKEPPITPYFGFSIGYTLKNFEK
jgi:hypothetical protein